MAPKIGIIIINWNGWRDTIECIKSVHQTDYSIYQIYVVDNASEDNSVAHLHEWCSDLRVIRSGKNLGWSGGNNLGIRAALADGCEHIYLLNNDARLRRDSLSYLVAAAAFLPKAAALGSVVISQHDPNWVEFAGSTVDPKNKHPGQISGKISDVLPASAEVPTIAVKGCSMLLTGHALQSVGFFADEYFLNYDETDWCYRAISLGFNNFLITKSMVDHKGAVSFDGTDSPLYRYFITRNRLLFARRHLGRRGRFFAWRCTLWEFKKAILLEQPIGKRSMRHRIFLSLAILLGLRDYCLNWLGDCPVAVRGVHRLYREMPGVVDV